MFIKCVYLKSFTNVLQIFFKCLSLYIKCHGISMPNVKCQMSWHIKVKCQMSNVKCQMSKFKSQMIKYQMHNGKSVDLVRSLVDLVKSK